MRDKQLVHLANVVDRATGDAYAVFRFSTGRCCERVTVPRADLSNPSRILSALLNKNADLPIGRDARHARDLIDRAARQQPRLLRQHVAMAGWHYGFKAYATGQRVADSVHRGRRLLPPRTAEPASRRKRIGSLETWKGEVARLCKYSSLMLFGQQVGYAAVLLKLIGWTSFGINLFSPSKVGKSTVLLAAASIYGGEDESDLSNWGATYASIGETCRLRNDALLPLNEIGLIRGMRKVAYEVIRPAIYQIAEGRETQRHSKSIYATPADSARYLLIFMSNAEHPLGYYAQLAGQQQDEGELARCIDMPALAAGESSIWDRLPEHWSEQQKKSALKALPRKVRSGCQRNSGAVPILTFARQIMKDPERIKREVRRTVDRFVDAVNRPEFDDVDRHRAACFGVIAAAGLLAARWDFLPVDEQCSWAVTRRFFGRAQETRRRPTNALREANEILLRHISSLPRETEVAAAALDHCGGFVREEAKESLCIINGKRFRSWFSSNLAYFPAIIECLKQSGCLVRVERRKPGLPDGDEFSHTLKWPSGKLRRSYVLRRAMLTLPPSKA